MTTLVRTTPTAIRGTSFYCAGCGHSVVLRLIAELADELGIVDRMILMRGVGCCSLVPRHIKICGIQCSHGKTDAAVTGVSRGAPDCVVLSYHGDGDAYTIGISETFNAGYRNENFVDIVINNTIFSMTGGQMSHTTLAGEPTTTTPKGRDVALTGIPIHYPEMVKDSMPLAFLARGSVHSPAEISATKGFIKRAIERQMRKEGYSLVEVLTMCPTNWKVSPLQSIEWMKENSLKEYRVGVIQDPSVREEGVAT